MPDSWDMSLISVTAPATYRALREALTAEEPFHQWALAVRADVSRSHANRVVQWLLDRRHAERLPDGRYRVRGAAGLVTSTFPYQRSMKEALVGSLAVRGSKAEVSKALRAAGAIACLETAIESYGQFFRANRVCVYHEEPERILDQLAPHQGGVLPVHVFAADIPLEGDVDEGWRTTQFRTVVDAACDGKAYAAKELFEELWGVILE